MLPDRTSNEEAPEAPSDALVAPPSAVSSPGTFRSVNDADNDQIKALKAQFKELCDEVRGEAVRLSQRAIQKPIRVGERCLEVLPGPDGKCQKVLHKSEHGTIRLLIQPDVCEPLVEKITELQAGSNEDELVPSEERWAEKRIPLDSVYELRKAWINALSMSDIEVISNDAGPGKRVQTVPNDGKGYLMGSIGRNGFALCRSGAYPSPLDAAHGTAWLNSMIEYRSFLPSTGTMDKGVWQVELPAEETIASLAVGSNFVAVLSNAPDAWLRVFSTSGVLLHLQAIGNGAPVLVVARNDHLMLVEQDACLPTNPSLDHHYRGLDILRLVGKQEISAVDFDTAFSTRNDRSHQRKYWATIYRVSSFTFSKVPAAIHRLYTAPLVLFGSEESLVWGGFTKSNIPILVSAKGRVFGLVASTTAPNFFPREQSHMSINAQSKGIPSPEEAGSPELLERIIQDTRNRLHESFQVAWTPLVPSLYALLQRTADRNRTHFAPVSASDDSILVDVVSYNADDVGGSAPQVNVPFRLPVATPPDLTHNPRVPTSLLKWKDYLSIDPDLTDQKEKLDVAGYGPLPWCFQDEIRYRQGVTYVNQLLQQSSLAPYELSEGFADEVKQRRAQLRNLRKTSELSLVRQILKMIDDHRGDGAMELAHHLTSWAGLNAVLGSINQHGWNGLKVDLETIRTNKSQLAEFQELLGSSDGPPPPPAAVENVPPADNSRAETGPVSSLAALLKVTAELRPTKKRRQAAGSGVV